MARFLSGLMAVVTLFTLTVLLAHIGPILTVEFRRSTISLPVNFPIAYYNSIPLIYCFGSIMLSIAYDLVFERKADQEALY